MIVYDFVNSSKLNAVSFETKNEEASSYDLTVGRSIENTWKTVPHTSKLDNDTAPIWRLCDQYFNGSIYDLLMIIQNISYLECLELRNHFLDDTIEKADSGPEFLFINVRKLYFSELVTAEFTNLILKVCPSVTDITINVKRYLDREKETLGIFTCKNVSRAKYLCRISLLNSQPTISIDSIHDMIAFRKQVHDDGCFINYSIQLQERNIIVQWQPKAFDKGSVIEVVKSCS